MKRSFLSEADRVKKWCLRNKRFEDANFITLIVEFMNSNEEITSEQAIRLKRILSLYTLDIDLVKKIKERMNWWRK